VHRAVKKRQIIRRWGGSRLQTGERKYSAFIHLY